MKIEENMIWPPMGAIEWKMSEHSAWYSGNSDIIANYYTEYARQNFLNLPYKGAEHDTFWGRQLNNQGQVYVHVPIAGDIAETSADFLFGESPTVKIAEAHLKDAASSFKDTQDQTDAMLLQSGFFKKILEGAEACAAIGGVYIKIAWDEELSIYPIPVIVQGDRGIPEFRFGILVAVTFWTCVEIDKTGTVVWRLLERYSKDGIESMLYKGTADKLGYLSSLTMLDCTKDIQDHVDTQGEFLAVYIPNKLPNRLDRTSYMGRSDYSGIEGLMDSLDETYSSWIKDIAISQGKIHIPESFLQNKSGNGGGLRYNLDKMVYVSLDIDPTIEGKGLTATQFAIRANEFEKTALNLMERIISSAGYSPQSFGLNIQGRAESGLALGIRERKSFATKGKKENYWASGIKEIIRLMLVVYNNELGGKIEVDATINIAFSDGITNNLGEVATSVKMISDAQAASTETKVRILHPEWDEEQIAEEVQKIKEDNAPPPMANPDMSQLGLGL